MSGLKREGFTGHFATIQNPKSGLLFRCKVYVQTGDEHAHLVVEAQDAKQSRDLYGYVADGHADIDCPYDAGYCTINSGEGVLPTGAGIGAVLYLAAALYAGRNGAHLQSRLGYRSGRAGRLWERFFTLGISQRDGRGPYVIDRLYAAAVRRTGLVLWEAP